MLWAHFEGIQHRFSGCSKVTVKDASTEMVSTDVLGQMGVEPKIGGFYPQNG